METLRRGWIAAGLAALAACGQGSSPTPAESHRPTALAITASPTAPAAGATFGATVEVRDAGGRKVASDATISLSLQGPGVLQGTSSAAAVQGVATFADLSITQAAAGYRVVATATGLTEATSAAFDVTPAAASRLAFTVEPPDAAAVTTIALTGGATAAPAVTLTAGCTGVALRTASDGSLEGATWSGAGGWTPFAAIAVGITTNAAPALAAMGSGAEAVYRGSDYKLYAATYGAGAWSPTAETVGTGASQSYTSSPPTLATVSGDAVVAYEDSSQIATARTRSAGSWATPVALASSYAPVAVGAPVALVAPSSGPELLAVWQGNSQQIFYATRSGGTWGAWHQLTGATLSGGDLPALAAGPGGVPRPVLRRSVERPRTRRRLRPHLGFPRERPLWRGALSGSARMAP
jgi:hypothetical protein